MSYSLLQQCVGRWQGTCRTWFTEGVLGDTAHMRGTIAPVGGLPIFRHVYEGSIKGKLRHGEEIIAWNGVRGVVQITWLDSFHMSQCLMHSEGPASQDGFSVTGSYDVGEGIPAWGWRTVYRLTGSALHIVAFNVAPNGSETLALETIYSREP